MINVKRFASVGAVTPQPTMLDWATVESAIKAFGTARESRERRFQRYVLCSYFDKLLGDTEECITEGGNDRGTDCIVFDREQGVVHFISTKTATTFDRAKRNFPSSELEKLRSFIDDLLLQRKALLDSANAVLRGHVLQIWEELEFGRRLRFHVHLFSSKMGLTSPDRDRFVEVLQRKEISFSEAHLVHIGKRVAHTIESPVRRQIRFIDDQRFEVSYCGARIIEGIVRATDIVSLTRDPDDGNFDNRLLHHNVVTISEMPTT